MIQDTSVSLDDQSRSCQVLDRGHLGQVCCIFSTSKARKTGLGTTLRGHGLVHYWLVQQRGESTYSVCGVDGDFLPFGDGTLIQAEELLAHYTPEVAVFEDRLLPAVVRDGCHSDNGRDLGGSQATFCIDEPHVRALFRLSLAYLVAHQVSKGRRLLNELLRLKTSYPGKNQFLFNRFGIHLRKIGFPEGAVICYRRALQYAETDDHLHYNLARAYYEQGQWWDCMNSLGHCFELNPALPLARDLVVLIAALARNPALRKRYGKPPVPIGVARQAGLLCESVFTHDAEARDLATDRVVAIETQERGAKTQSPAGLWLPGRDAVGL